MLPRLKSEDSTPNQFDFKLKTRLYFMGLYLSLNLIQLLKAAVYKYEIVSIAQSAIQSHWIFTQHFFDLRDIWLPFDWSVTQK